VCVLEEVVVKVVAGVLEVVDEDEL